MLSPEFVAYPTVVLHGLVAFVSVGLIVLAACGVLFALLRVLLRLLLWLAALPLAVVGLLAGLIWFRRRRRLRA